MKGYSGKSLWHQLNSLNRCTNIAWKAVVYIKTTYEPLLIGSVSDIIDGIEGIEDICRMTVINRNICGEYYEIQVLERG